MVLSQLRVVGLGCIIVVSGCSTLRDSVLVGSGVGLSVGAVSGGLLNKEKRAEGALLGGVIGAAVGAIGGLISHKFFDDRDSKVRRDTLFNLEKYNVASPSGVGVRAGGNDFRPRISNPEIDFEWIDTHIQGKKLIEGHRVWKITEEPQWITEEIKP